MVANKLSFRVAGAFVAAAATALGAVVPAVQSQNQPLVTIDGSSTVFPITEAVAEEFIADTRGRVQVTVGVSGTGGGFKKFCVGETDISNASRPIKESERELCAENGVEFIEIPVAFDALTVVINPENDWATTLTTEELKTIWEASAQGTITNWNQVRSGFPDEELILYGPGTDSGTFDYFGEAIIDGDSRGDYTASEDDNILVQGVQGDANALGYFGFAYYEENKDKLKAVGIDDGNPDNGDGAIYPSAETVENGTYVPLSRPIFIYVNADEAANNPIVRGFVRYYLANAPELVAEVGYVPFGSSTYRRLQSVLRDREVGSRFSGVSTVGLTIEEVLNREFAE